MRGEPFVIEKSLYDIKIDQHRFQIPLGPVEGSITAVIPTCGKSKLLDQCLDSLDDETKVILVANGDHKAAGEAGCLKVLTTAL